MKTKLILQLSLFGLAMAVGTVYWIPSTIEPVFWIIIFLICAYIIAKNCTEKFFLTGFLTSLANCVWITGTHILLFKDYASNHVKEMNMMSGSPFMTEHPRLMMLITGPVIGIISGLVLGLFAFLAAKIMKKN
jgi:hypothetical protein